MDLISESEQILPLGAGSKMNDHGKKECVTFLMFREITGAGRDGEIRSITFNQIDMGIIDHDIAWQTNIPCDMGRPIDNDE